MSAHFDVVAGSVQGTFHKLRGSNNQDAYSIFSNEKLLIAVVCDGCGSTPHAEVGAQLGSRFLTNALARQYDSLTDLDDGYIDPTALWLYRGHDLLVDFLKSLAEQLSLSDNPIDAVLDYLLFTIVGCAITPELATFFSLGDGVMAINGEITQLGPFPGNAPPYIAYNLIHDGRQRFGDELTRFTVVKQLPTTELDSFMIGCDGVTQLAEAASKALPGSDKLVGPMEQFWTDNMYFRNPQTLQRKLNLLNSSRIVIDPDIQVFIRQDHGLLSDDTTLIVGRRAS